MATELLGRLLSVRSAVEKGAQTWESAPADSQADASFFEGAEIERIPVAAEWLKQRVTETPEEDVITDALGDVLKSRGSRPAHAPGAPTSDDADRINTLADSLMALQRQKLKERGELETEKEQLAKREQEVAALEQEMRLEKQRQQQREIALQHYPQPDWLVKYEGTMNVAVTGNAGVGKSLLINCIRRVKNGSCLWAEVGVVETTMSPTMYAFPGKQELRIWDLPGAGTEKFPLEGYTRNMGLRYFDSVLIVSAARSTETEIALRKELEHHGVPFLMVRTKVDIDIWNNLKDSDKTISEDATLESIREDLKQQHGTLKQEPYLVSSRDPDKYDMPALMREAFPGLKKTLDATAPAFEPSDTSGWGDSWSLPAEQSTLLSAIQGQWKNSGSDGPACVYIVDGSKVHITLASGTALLMTVTEDHSGGIWWNNRWCLEAPAIATARETGELRWTPVDISVQKPMIWRWDGFASATE